MKLADNLRVALSRAMDEAKRRRHEYLTLEHVLLALLHEPTSAAALEACGAKVDKLEKELTLYLDNEVEKLPEDRAGLDPQQTMAFSRVFQRAAFHVQSAGKELLEGTAVLIELMREPESYAVYLLETQNVKRVDMTAYLSHGVRKDGLVPQRKRVSAGGDDEDSGDLAEPLEAYTTELVARAAAGEIDPLIGRQREIERIVHILARRRKNNPLLLGDPGVGKTALIEGLARLIHHAAQPVPRARRARLRLAGRQRLEAVERAAVVVTRAERRAQRGRARLVLGPREALLQRELELRHLRHRGRRHGALFAVVALVVEAQPQVLRLHEQRASLFLERGAQLRDNQIGRASCRERV